MKRNFLIAVLAVASGLFATGAMADQHNHGDNAKNAKSHAAPMADRQKEIALYTTMRKLWADHMQWTFATVHAFYHNQQALQPTLDRLLQNQKEIGAAVGSFYGKAAGGKLADLLTIHIKQAVPVLTAAKTGDKAALDKGLADWYANAKDIANFLSAANPENWPASATEPALKHHISTTTSYAVNILKGDYAKTITDYDAAFDHMMAVADILSKGLIAKFPDKFKG